MENRTLTSGPGKDSCKMATLPPATLASGPGKDSCKMASLPSHSACE
ncbi:hypothetical protein Dde_4038 [Oleidesulfovibrio alaskensis G20]|jgi:sulfur relay (sulfurtransferase) DsrC/TusE family protein|uniref:Uncharacterized protein n=1 Tax=Oleidesulfovibrio alaskensis (strain ATCC BAA-1058 / DSM 17464 / G20) TaxID=207559 RepID=F9XXH9_OLEA2|nr:hypothetical protein [Oleidesulfovibrio alaskensis]AEL79442.1 hypothetical protein Dde_4038 [Oleidesulfovibrio alaskensis G20]MBG0772092.1 hypothetical protein [Oleidesulfovibrio alaskensis]MBL3581272.1 hypothetical protein [Oleidesulfovibrio alaskensis]